MFFPPASYKKKQSFALAGSIFLVGFLWGRTLPVYGEVKVEAIEDLNEAPQTQFGLPCMNEAGEVVFWAKRKIGEDYVEGIFQGDSEGINEVFIQNDEWENPGKLPFINSSGDIYFLALDDFIGAPHLIKYPDLEDIDTPINREYPEGFVAVSSSFEYVLDTPTNGPTYFADNPADSSDRNILAEIFDRFTETHNPGITLLPNGDLFFAYQKNGSSDTHIRKASNPRFVEDETFMQVDISEAGAFENVNALGAANGLAYVNGISNSVHAIYSASQGNLSVQVAESENFSLGEELAVGPGGTLVFYGEYADEQNGVFFRGLFTDSGTPAGKIVANGDRFTIGTGDFAGEWRFDRISDQLGVYSVNSNGRVVFHAEIVSLDGTREAVGIFSTTGVETPEEDPDEYRWTNFGGGLFSIENNWESNSVPGQEDAAVFDLAADYTVSFNNDWRIKEARVSGSGSELTLNPDDNNLMIDRLFVGYNETDNTTLLPGGDSFIIQEMTLGHRGTGKFVLGPDQDFSTDILNIGGAQSEFFVNGIGTTDPVIGAVTLVDGLLKVDGKPEYILAGVSLSKLDIWSGRVELLNGATLQFSEDESIWVGSFDQDLPAVLVADGIWEVDPLFVSSGFQADQDLWVGALNAGRLEVRNGAAINVANHPQGSSGANHGEISIAVAAPGDVLVSGTTSYSNDSVIQAELSGKSIHMGSLGGTGTLTIENGGRVISLESTIGSAGGPEQQVYIGGASQGYKAEWDAEAMNVINGTIEVNTEGQLFGVLSGTEDGNLLVLEGGLAELTSITNYDGYLRVSGVSPVTIPSRVEVANNAFFGFEAPAEVDVENGAVLKINGQCVLGVGTQGTRFVVRGRTPTSRSTLEFDEVQIGGFLSENSNGEIEVEDGSIFNSNQVTIQGSIETDPQSGTQTLFASNVSLTSGVEGSAWYNEGKITVGGDNLAPAFIKMTPGNIVTDDMHIKPGGAVFGTGLLVSNNPVVNDGYIAPGLSPGTLEIEGGLTQTATGTLEIEIFGLNPEDQDLLIVDGDVQLGGTLSIVFKNQLPSIDEEYPLMKISGSYTEQSLKMKILGLSPTFQSRCEVIDGKLSLIAESDATAVTPEDPIQMLDPQLSNSGILHLNVFGVTGATYHFESSTDLSFWETLNIVEGNNELMEFSHVDSSSERRFYRIRKVIP